MRDCGNKHPPFLDNRKSGDPVATAEKYISTRGGALFALREGYEAARVILNSVPGDAHLRSELIMSVLCFDLMKRGRARRAFGILNGPDVSYTRTYVTALLELATTVHLGEFVTSEQLERWKRLEGQLPLDDPLFDGLYHNCMIVTLVRLNRVSEAQTAGIQALEAYGLAGRSYLQFYIHLHLADLAVLEGRMRSAQRHARAAERILEDSDTTYGNESELLEIVRLAVDFEHGRLERIPADAVRIRKALIQGDSWPEIFNQLCRIGALSIYYTAGYGPALTFLEEAQIDFQKRHSAFSPALDVVQAIILLLEGRNDEAASGLAAAEADRMQSALGQSMLERLRYRLGRDPELLPHANVRFQVDGALTSAERAREEGTLADARRHVERALRIAQRDGLVSPFLEHRGIVRQVSARLATGKFARGHVQLSRMAKRVDRLVRASFVTPRHLAGYAITKQQLRVLSALQGGGSNKQIARSLGLSEATVKYHVSRLLRKFGASKRGELIEITSV